MLNDEISVTYIPEGTTPSVTTTYERDGFPVTKTGISFARFVDANWVNDPSIPKTWLTMTPTEPKKTAVFNGVRRGHIALYREVTVPTPNGTTVEAPANIHINTSLPDGMTAVEIEKLVRLTVALLSSQACLDHIKSSQV